MSAAAGSGSSSGSTTGGGDGDPLAGPKSSTPLEIGAVCSLAHCTKRDFLPFTCAVCSHVYCLEHRTPTDHACPSTTPNLNDSGTAATAAAAAAAAAASAVSVSSAANPLSFRCSIAGCSTREIVPVSCKTCKQNFCLSHRFPSDHACSGVPKSAPPPSAFEPALTLLFTSGRASDAAGDEFCPPPPDLNAAGSGTATATATATAVPVPSNSDIDSCARLLITIVTNILRKPIDAKYRSINAQSLNSRLSLPGAVPFLHAVGFTADPKRNRLEFVGSNAQLTAGLAVLQRRHRQWSSQLQTAVKATSTDAAAEEADSSATASTGGSGSGSGAVDPLLAAMIQAAGGVTPSATPQPEPPTLDPSPAAVAPTTVESTDLSAPHPTATELPPQAVTKQQPIATASAATAAASVQQPKTAPKPAPATAAAAATANAPSSSPAAVRPTGSGFMKATADPLRGRPPPPQPPQQPQQSCLLM